MLMLLIILSSTFSIVKPKRGSSLSLSSLSSSSLSLSSSTSLYAKPKRFVPSIEENQQSKDYPTVGTGAQYFREISNIFETNSAIYSNDDMLKAEAQKTLTEEIRQFVVSSKINGAHMSSIIQKCAKAKIDVTLIFDMNTILTNLNKKSHSDTFTAIELAQLLYGIRSFTPYTNGIDMYLDFAYKKLIESNDKWRGREIGNAIFGLQNMPNSERIDKILNAIADKIKSQVWGVKPMPITLNSQELSNALFGLRKLSSDSIATLNVLDSIRIILETSNNIVLNQQGFGNSLNGLQGMSSDQEIVRSFITTITPLIENSDLKSQPLTDRGLCGALMGLRSFSSHQEVLKLISIITAKFKESSVCLTNNHISHALSSLKNFDNKSNEIKDLLSIITQRIIPNYGSSWKPDIVSNSLIGLRKMTLSKDADSQDLTTLLQMISAHLSTSTDPRDYYTSIDIGRALLGVQSISATQSEAVQEIIGKMAVEIEKSNGIIRITAQDIGLALFGLRAQVDSSLPEIKNVLTALTKSIKLCKDSTFSPQVLTMAMLGLSSLSSSQEVYTTISALSDKLSKVDAVSIGSLVFSLKKLLSDAPEVKAFLKKLIPLIDSCQSKLNSQELANAYYGLSNMDNDHSEVVDLIRALNVKLKEAKSVQFTAQGISNSISGFQSMQLSLSDGKPKGKDEITTALEILADKLDECTEDFSALNIANIIFGLQGMSSEVEAARAVLQAVLPKMIKSTDKFTERDIGYCLAGLSSMQSNPCEESNAILSELNFKVVQAGFGDKPSVVVKMYGKGVRLIRS